MSVASHAVVYELDVLPDPANEDVLPSYTESGPSTAANSTARFDLSKATDQDQDTGTQKTVDTMTVTDPAAAEFAQFDADPSHNELELAPVDTGFAAWSFLAAAFVVEMLVWSFPFAYGIFLTAYLAEPHFADQPNSATLLPLVGTLSSGVIYLTGPVIYPLLARYPQHRRASAWIGAVMCFVSLLGASYVTKITSLVALQGVIYGIGGSMLYAPCISFLSEWFVVRRGLATGIIFMGSATGGLVLPFILPPLIRAHGASITLRILSIALFILLLPALPFMRPRLPASRVHGPGRRSGRRAWLKDRSWWALVVCNTVQGFGHFVPQLWLPTFAGALNLSSSSTSLALALLNGTSLAPLLSVNKNGNADSATAASAAAPLILGFLSDRFQPWLLALLTASFASVATFVLWGVVGHAFAGLIVFGMAYGLLTGGWSTLWSGFLRSFAKDDPALATMLYGFLMLTRGLGNVLCTPISTSLSSITSPSMSLSNPMFQSAGKTGFEVADGRFEKLIIYVGSCFAGAAAVALVGWGGDKAGRMRP
ncbi:MFS general substrate transporter [Dentipellis sp. KUC8613]|nr:MFS general substrate transporter [Dentipellis sp. KUC8613]